MNATPTLERSFKAMPTPSASTSPVSPTFLDSPTSASSSSSSSSSSADLPPLYLRHILTCPPSDAIPLRNMFASNVLAQQRPRTPSPAASAQSKAQRTRSPSIPGRKMPPLPGGNPAREPTTIEAMQFIPCPAQSLPPSFITTFVRRVFTEDLCLVDFTQALTGMDYLKVLDDRKRREIAAALRRLDVDVEALGRSREDLRTTHPRIAEWLAMIDDKGKKVEALYTQVYIGLRRWTLINEMRLTPFNKQNCIAMLNALYPPHYPHLPTVQLTETILNAQRNAFFRYIQAVEKSGRGVLASLELSGRRPGSLNGWPVVRDLVDVYLARANEIIAECMAIQGPESFGGKRADSGVSFGSHDTTLTANSFGGPSAACSSTSSAFLEKPLPPQPPPPQPPACDEVAPLMKKKKSSRLESFARELRRMRSKSADHKDELDLRASAKASSFRSLRKMRSTSALTKEGNSKKEGSHSRGNSSDRGGAAALYEIDEAQRERLLREAHRDKENRMPKRTASPPATEFPLSSAAHNGRVHNGGSRAGSPEHNNYSLPWTQPGAAAALLHHPLLAPPPVPRDVLPAGMLGQPSMPAELSA